MTSLTGIWHGLYSYPRYLQPVYFVATLVSFGKGFSGTTHEALVGVHGAPLTAFATVDGALEGYAISFLKFYDGSGGMRHSVNYDGTLRADGNEIDGTWNIAGSWSGRFLMIRNRGASEAAVRKVYEEAP
jgi:hypothetical protein